MDFDVVIAGGSIAGLLCAREISNKGYSVLVLEEDYEIGTPEHCGGLVSLSGLEELGILPHLKTFDYVIEKANIYSPSGKKITIDSTEQKVGEVRRRELDKQIALQARKEGAEIRVKSQVREFTERGIRTSDEEIACQIIVDARGVSPLIQKDRSGMLSSAQYEVYAEWIKRGEIEVHIDQQKYPGFFAWVIPSTNNTGKVGVAGRNINAATTLEEFLKSRGDHMVIRKIFAPIWVKGPIDDFVQGNIVRGGDAAGQSKPTTAGGIYSCGMGGIFAGKAISRFLHSKDKEHLRQYQKMWHERFGKEFNKQHRVRRLLETLDNKAIDNLFELISPKMIEEISKKGNFDFHSGSIIKLLGLKGTLKTAQVVLGGEIRKVLGQDSTRKV